MVEMEEEKVVGTTVTLIVEGAAKGHLEQKWKCYGISTATVKSWETFR